MCFIRASPALHPGAAHHTPLTVATRVIYLIRVSQLQKLPETSQEKAKICHLMSTARSPCTLERIPAWRWIIDGTVIAKYSNTFQFSLRMIPAARTCIKGCLCSVMFYSLTVGPHFIIDGANTLSPKEDCYASFTVPIFFLQVAGIFV